MTEEDWGIVIANNALTCAYNLVTGTVKGKDNKPELHVLGAKRSLYPGMAKLPSQRLLMSQLLTDDNSFSNKGSRSCAI